MKKFYAMAVTGALLLPAMASAQLFPVTAGNTADFASVKADIVAWAALIIGVVLALYAFRKVKGLVK
jgi:hypothetical protein